MVEFAARVDSTELIDDAQRVTVIIPAFNRMIASRRARAFSRLKGLEVVEISEPEQVGTGDVPGQKIFEVVIEADR